MEQAGAPVMAAVPTPVEEGDEAEKQSTTGPATPGAAPATQEPSLSTHYHVRRVDGGWHVGEVIQKRNNLENGLTEYYVHYKDSEWSNWVSKFCAHFVYASKRERERERVSEREK